MNEFLNRIDSFFNEKISTPFEKTMAFVIIALLFGALSRPLIPIAESMASFQKGENKALKKQVAEEKAYLASITVNGDRTFYIRKNKAELAKLKKELESYKEKVRKLRGLSGKLSPPLFNRKNWAEFLDGVASAAEDRGLKVGDISNSFIRDENNKTQSFSQSVNVRGSFRGMAGLLKDLEEQEMITSIDSIRMKADENGSGMDFNVSVWGMKL